MLQILTPPPIKKEAFYVHRVKAEWTNFENLELEICCWKN